jgi:hypothetical protein
MNVSIKRGNDRNLRITVKKDGAVVDITGWTIYFAVKRKPNDTDANAIISKVVTSHEDAANGVSVIEIDGDDTRTEKVGNYVFDIRVKDDADKEQSSETGVFEIVQEIADGEAIS